MNGHDEVVKILLQAGTDLNIQNEVNNLKWWHTLCLTQSLTAGHLTICIYANLLCIHVCFYPTQWGRVALNIGCTNGHVKVVKIMLQAGADLNIQNNVSNFKW